MLEKTIRYKINGNRNEIFSAFIDLKAYGDFHPLIKKVTILNGLEDSIEYQIIERPYNWIPIRIKYKARVKKIGEDEILYEIYGIPFTKGKIFYQFIEQQEIPNLEIVFNLQLDSKLIGKKILFNKMIKAQELLMENLKKLVES